MKKSSNLSTRGTNRRSSFLNRGKADEGGPATATPVSTRWNPALAPNEGLRRFLLIYLPKSLFSNFSAADKNLFLFSYIPHSFLPSKPE